MDAQRTRASVLVVDDDRKSLLALQELLASFGQHAVAAGSGEEALARALERDFAVILLDARMPGMDGFETARRMRERPHSRHTPIIFLTGAYEDLGSMFRGYEAGAVDYIVKPLVPEMLKSKIAVFGELFRKSEELRVSQENLRALTEHLQSVREDERARIAREIHDQLGQALTGLKMDVAWLAKRLPAGQQPVREKMDSIFELIDDTVQAVRRIASGLRPEVLDHLGLAAAIQWQLREFQMRTGVRCRLTLPEQAIAVDAERSTALFRIFQELLTNVTRHAEATRLDVSMQADNGSLVLEVRDNGKGIEAERLHSPRSLGLLGMRERVLPFAGRFEIEGARGKGTCATISIPLGASRAAMPSERTP